MQLAGVAFCGHGDKVSLFFSKRPETVDQNREGHIHPSCISHNWRHVQRM